MSRCRNGYQPNSAEYPEFIDFLPEYLTMETNEDEYSDAEDLSKTINRLGGTVQEKTLISVQIDDDVTQ